MSRHRAYFSLPERRNRGRMAALWHWHAAMPLYCSPHRLQS